MTFLNLILLGGVAAFSVPLLIHLLNRSRFRTIEWGAMHLLDSAFQTNNKRIRIEQLILLLIRCSIPVLLAFCLARPVYTAWQALPGETPLAIVVALDNSYSMEAGSTTGTAFSNATESACQILESLQRGSEISVINMGGKATPVFDTPVFDAHMMNRQLRERTSGFGAADTAQSIEAALDILSNASLAQRELVLISDFQANNWTGLDDAFVERIKGELAAMPVRPQVTFFQTKSDPKGNVALQSLDYSRTALGVGQTLNVRANVKNFDVDDHVGLRLSLLVNGEQQSMSQVQLGGNASAQVLFTHQFKRAGSHLIEVVLEHDDALARDNRIAASITVLDRIDVLLVDGAPSEEPLESETDFLSIALTPFTTGGSTLADLVQVQTVLPGQLDADLLGGSDVVVLANIEKLPSPELERLKSYVINGGNLLLFPGDKTDVTWHNSRMAKTGLLPMGYGELQGSKTEKRKQTRILAQHFDHPALYLFNDRSNGNLADGDIWVWFQLMRPGGTHQDVGDINSAETNHAAETNHYAETNHAAGINYVAGGNHEVTTLARLANGDPFLVEKRLGEGLVAQAATACDAQWSNLPTRPSFLPLVQELVVKMATRVAPPRNIAAGDNLVAALPSEAEGQTFTLTTPNQQQFTLQATKRGDKCLVEFANTQMTGVYRLQGAKEGSLFFVSSTGRFESDLRPVDPERLTEIATAWEANVVESFGERARVEELRQNGRELWRYLLMAVFALLALEIFLQQKFSGVSHAG